MAANLTDTIAEKEIIDKIIPAYEHIQTGRRNKPSAVAFIVAILENGEWKVYDVVIEGVSLVQNYRTQFREILTNKTPEDLLKTLREKTRK